MRELSGFWIVFRVKLEHWKSKKTIKRTSLLGVYLVLLVGRLVFSVVYDFGLLNISISALVALNCFSFKF